jgi:hypothetical protein
VDHPVLVVGSVEIEEDIDYEKPRGDGLEQ